MNWLRSILGGENPEAEQPADQPLTMEDLRVRGGSLQRVRDIATQDVEVRPFADAHFPAEYRVRLLHTLAHDPNIRRVWVLSVSSRGLTREVLLSVDFIRPSTESVEGLIARVNALAGPPCAVGLAKGGATMPAFYERA